MSLYRSIAWFMKGMKEYTKNGYLSASKSFNAADLDVDVSHRSFMVTGANKGIGRYIAMAIAKKGGTVHMVCRSQERGQAAQKEIQEQTGNQKLHLHIVDMSRPAEIVAFVDQFKNSHQPLHVLINNAGVLVTGDKRQLTEEGLEVTFATNTLGVHLLTLGLLPVLKRSEDPRVIIVTSGGMLVQKLDVDDPQLLKMSKFDGTMVYSQTKRQEVVLTSHYAKLHPEVHFSSMHPGWTDTPGVQDSLPQFHAKMKDKLRTEEEGSDTLLWLAVSAAATKFDSGLFFQDRKPVPSHLPLAWTKSSPAEEDKFLSKLAELSKQYGAIH